MKGDSAFVSTTEAQSTSAQVQHEAAAVLWWNLFLGVTLHGLAIEFAFHSHIVGTNGRGKNKK